MRQMDERLAALIAMDAATLNELIATGGGFRERLIFGRGELVAIADQPWEVVMHKGTTVYVKDEAGKVTGFYEERVARL